MHFFIRVGRVGFASFLAVIHPWAVKIRVEFIGYVLQVASHRSHRRSRGVGIASDGLLDDFVIEDVSVVNVLAHFEAIGDVFCHGGSEGFELAVPR